MARKATLYCSISPEEKQAFKIAFAERRTNMQDAMYAAAMTWLNQNAGKEISTPDDSRISKKSVLHFSQIRNKVGGLPAELDQLLRIVERLARLGITSNEYLAGAVEMACRGLEACIAEHKHRGKRESEENEE